MNRKENKRYSIPILKMFYFCYPKFLPCEKEKEKEKKKKKTAVHQQGVKNSCQRQRCFIASSIRNCYFFYFKIMVVDEDPYNVQLL